MKGRDIVNIGGWCGGGQVMERGGMYRGGGAAASEDPLSRGATDGRLAPRTPATNNIRR